MLIFNYVPKVVPTGKVFGVLQRGVADPKGQIIPGLVKAEPVYPILRNDLMKRIKEALPGQIAKIPFN